MSLIYAFHVNSDLTYPEVRAFQILEYVRLAVKTPHDISHGVKKIRTRLSPEKQERQNFDNGRGSLKDFIIKFLIL